MHQGSVAAFLNWNNQHWTVLIGSSRHGPWTHINSIFEGMASFHGRVHTLEQAKVHEIVSDIREQYGSCSLHRIVRATSAGEQFLAAAGRRAMLPPEDEVPPDLPESTTAAPRASDAADSGVVLEVSLVTVNVDGMGEDYTRSPSERITAILEEVLRKRPSFILMQEVTIEMYAVIKRILAGWQVYRRHEQAEKYFNVTAVHMTTTAGSKCTSFAFPTSRNGRHTLTVRNEYFVVTNVHAESLSSIADRDERSRQLLHMSRLHENDADRPHFICGDFNARPGEDQCLWSEGWRDAWPSPRIEDWTWQKHGCKARYDRVFMHSSSTATARCLHIDRLTGVWGSMTDHVALHAVVRMVPFATIPSQINIGVRDPAAVEAGPMEKASATSSSVGDPQNQLTNIPNKGHNLFGLRPKVQVVAIGSVVGTEAMRFHELVNRCQEDPTQRPDMAVEMLKPWPDIPLSCGFRILQPGVQGARRRATPADKLAQQQQYAKACAWAAECGLSEDELRSKLEDVPSNKAQRGFNGVRHALRHEDQCSSWEHARRLCVTEAIDRAAGDAGRCLGGESMAKQAVQEVLELMSSEGTRSSNSAPQNTFLGFRGVFSMFVAPKT